MMTGATIMCCWAVERHEHYEKGKGKGKIEKNPTTPMIPYIDIRPPLFLLEAMKREG